MPDTGFKETELFLLHEIVIRLDRLARTTILDPEGITYPEFLVLMAARELPSSTQDGVAEYLDMSKSLVSQRVSSLMLKGLALQQADPESRRKINLVLTEAGSTKVEAIYAAMVHSTDELFESLGSLRGTFRDALAGLAGGLAKAEGE